MLGGLTAGRRAVGLHFQYAPVLVIISENYNGIFTTGFTI